MESLLRWSIENTASDDVPRPPPEPRQDLDPGIIDAILGRPDAVLMKEALAVGIDSTLEAEARVTALDDLEMLVEQIDNATNLTPLKMYPPIISLLSPQTPDAVRMQALWILGTAVQNNPKAQADFIGHDPLSTILSILSPSGASKEPGNPPSVQTRSKAAYALSAALRHNALAVLRLGEVGGWEVLRDALQDSDITIRRKIAFLINTLLLPTSLSVSSTAAPDIPAPGPTIHTDPAPPPTSAPSTAVTLPSSAPTLPPGLEPTATSLLAFEALRTHRIVATLVDSLISPLPHGPDADGDVDPDYAEKAARALVTYLEIGGVLEPSEKEQLRSAVSKGPDIRDEWGLDEAEWDTLRKKCDA